MSERKDARYDSTSGSGLRQLARPLTPAVRSAVSRRGRGAQDGPISGQRQGRGTGEVATSTITSGASSARAYAGRSARTGRPSASVLRTSVVISADVGDDVPGRWDAAPIAFSAGANEHQSRQPSERGQGRQHNGCPAISDFIRHHGLARQATGHRVEGDPLARQHDFGTGSGFAQDHHPRW